MVQRAPFTPPNRAALWASLALTKVQLARLCGLSLRQVGWWAARGYLPRSARHPEHYSGEAVDMAVLIRQGLAQGLPLRQAVRQARAYLAAETTRQPGLLALDEAALRAIATRLTQADTAAQQVLAVVAPLTRPTEAAD